MTGTAGRKDKTLCVAIAGFPRGLLCKNVFGDSYPIQVLGTYMRPVYFVILGEAGTIATKLSLPHPPGSYTPDPNSATANHI